MQVRLQTQINPRLAPVAESNKSGRSRQPRVPVLEIAPVGMNFTEELHS